MKKFAKILSVVLCLAMIVSFAAMAFADETKTQITTLDELTTGTYVLTCSNGASLGVIDGTWITNAESVWTLTVTDAGVTMQDANGAFLAPKGGNSNGLSEAEYAWAVSCSDGMFSFLGQGDDTVTLAFNSSPNYMKFRGYKNATVSGDNAESYPSTFALYKVGDDFQGETPTTQAPTTQAPVAPAEQLTFVEAPVAGTAYKFGLTQHNIGKTLYLTGEMNGYYYATTESAEAAVDVYVELVEGGMKLYFTKDGAKLYLSIVQSGNYTNVVFAETGSVFAYDAVTKSLQTDLNGTMFYLGTYNTYNTISASKTSFINAENTCVSQFPAGLVAIETEVEPPVTEPTEPETTAPVAPETTAPVIPETTAPVAPETTAPVAPETTAPVAPETTAPVAPETTAPVAPETTAPVAPETTAPVAPETTAPVAPETTAPVAPETSSAAPETTVPTTTAPAGGDVDNTGDSSVVVMAVCVMMAAAAVVVLVQKKRAF